MSGFSSVPITGIQADGKIYPRPEINTWAVNNPIQLSLYIRALQIFQSLPFEDVRSYFQIAGIHGLPAIPWDNDPAPMEASKSYNSNQKYYNYKPAADITPDFYCPHNSLLFPTWHRVYVLLFEQRLWEIMNKDIVPKWQEAANSWRLPYWDWAADPSVPAIVREETIPIVEFDGTTLSTTSNPLYRFSTGAIKTFRKSGSAPLLNDRSSFGQWTIFNDAPLSATSGTSRWGLSDPPHSLNAEQVAGIENNHWVDKALQDPDWTVIEVGPKGKTSTHLCGSLLDQVSRLFVPTNFDNYAEFATTAHGGSEPNGWLSLEMIHNYIHDLVGGVGWNLDPSQAGGHGGAPDSYGHMADLGTAAFDPIFWLHHCNVDRQFAIYQHNNGKGQWFTGATKDIDPTSQDNLYPFHTDTEFTNYTSDMVRDWTKLGYTYPDLAPETDSSSTFASREEVQKRLTEKYGILRRILAKVGSELDIEGLDNDFVINVKYNRFALNGSSYIVHFFIGKESDIPKSPADYKLSPDHVGSIHTFSANYWTRGNKNGIKCDNCQKQQEIHQLSKGQVPVTLQLLQRALSKDERWAAINHLGKDHVVKYLTEHLHWRAVAVPGKLLDTADLPDLKVFFKAGKAEHPEDPAKPSKYFGYEHRWEVTQGKVGGAKPE